MKRPLLLLPLLALALPSFAQDPVAGAPDASGAAPARRARFKAEPDRAETNGCEFARVEGGWELRGVARRDSGQYHGLPEVVRGEAVVSVARSAFAGRAEAVWIKLPSTVERIDPEAFRGCTALQSLDLRSRIGEIPADAFSDCRALSQVLMPTGLRSIGARAFKGTGVQMFALGVPASLRSIGEEAFAGTPFRDAQLLRAEALESIGPRAFAGCAGLSRLTVPPGLREIGDGAFEGCSSLSLVHRLESSSVERIGDGAFRGCAALRDIHLPKTLRSIGAGAFAGCSSLALASFAAPPESTGEGAFAGCAALAELKWPEGAGPPDESLFPDSPLPFPRPATDFDPDADPSWIAFRTGEARLFARRTPQGPLAVTGVWPRDVRAVAVPAHIGPTQVDAVEAAAFANLPALETAEVDWRVKRVGARLFENCAALRTATLPDVEGACPDGAFRGCRSLERVEWRVGGESRGARKVGAGAFEGCAALADLSFLGSPRSAGDRAFAGCTGLRELAGLTFESLGDGAFAGCSNLASVAFAGRLRRIPDGAFAGCPALASVDLGGCAASVGAGAFAGCRALRELRGAASGAGAGAFEGCEALGAVRFEGCTGIGRAAFAGCRALREAVVSGPCGTLGAGAFEGCTNLVRAALPGSVGEIPPRAFAGCAALADLSLGDGPRAIGAEAFEGCAALPAVRLDSAEVVGDRAFAGCAALSSAVFSYRLSAVGRQAFAGTALETFAAPGQMLYVGEGAFGDRIKLLAFGRRPPAFERPGLSDLPEGCVVHAGFSSDEDLARWKERYAPVREIRMLRPGTDVFRLAAGGDAAFLESAARLEGKEAPGPEAAEPGKPEESAPAAADAQAEAQADAQAEAARRAAAEWRPGPGDWRGLEHAAEWAEAVRTNAALRVYGDLLRESVRPVLRADLLAPGAGPLETAIVDRLADLVWSGELDAALDDPAAPLWADLSREAGAALAAEPDAGPVPRWLAGIDRFGRPGFEPFVPPPDASPLAGALAMRTAAWRESVADRATGTLVGLLAAWCEAHAGRPQDSRTLFHVCDALARPCVRALAERLAGSSADPWVADLLLARAAVREGYRINSNLGRAGNWSEARDALLRAWNRAPDRPEAAVCMQEVSMWGGGGDSQLWFARALHLEADAPLAYHFQWHYAYLPIWGGSKRMLDAFADACRATRRHDTMIPAQAFEIRNAARSLVGREDRTRHLLFDGPERLAELEEVLAPLATNANATISFRALGIVDLPILLLWGGEPEKAGEAFERARPLWREPMGDAAARFPVEALVLRGLSGPHRADVRAMERAFHARDWTNALARAAALLALPDLAPEEREAVAARSVEAALRSTYAAGEWVDVGQDPSGAGWKAFAASGWTPAPGGGYRHGPFAPASTNALERGKLRWTGWNAPPRFDVEATVRFDPADGGAPRWFALCPDEEITADRRKDGVPVLWIAPDGAELSVRFGTEEELVSGGAPELARAPWQEGAPVRLALRGRFMFLDVELDGRTVLKSFQPPGWGYPRYERRRLWTAASGAAFSEMRVRAVKPSARVPDLGFPLPPDIGPTRWICGEFVSAVPAPGPAPSTEPKDAKPKDDPQ